ncbi:unnamed protein product [Gongylonema pulchrum]|uniref:Uncharacterized protein n=1 Tax=Gongylonema pulchrum TaxID=637853 RepID=A0A183ED21_9BILA|nr:unnamed protein product [Gongylonema pulchrum]
MNQERTEFDYSSLRLAPLQYTFEGPEMYAMEEPAAARQNSYAELTPLPDLFFPERTNSSQAVEEEKAKQNCGGSVVSHELNCDSRYNCCCQTKQGDATAVPSESASSDDEEASSSCSSDEEDYGGYSGSEDISEKRLHSLASSHRRRRKRKTSAQRLPSPCGAKKCCLGERQLTGFISVFNSGLSVVADQLLTRPSPSPVPTLQPAPKHPFMHIACNPLIC